MGRSRFVATLSLSVPVAQAMAGRINGSIDFAVRGAVIGNLAYANLAREIWLESKLDPHVPTFTTTVASALSRCWKTEQAVQ